MECKCIFYLFVRIVINSICFCFLFRKYYYPPDAYNQSKLAQVLFTKHLQVLLSGAGVGAGGRVQVHAVHPGVVDTDLFVHSSSTYIPWVKKILFKVCVCLSFGCFFFF